MFLMGLLLLWYLYGIATYHGNRVTPLIIQLLRCVTAVLAVYLGQLWKERPFRFLSVFWLLLLFRVLIPRRALPSDGSVEESLFLALWLFTGCFGLGKILTEKQLKRMLLLLAAVWTAGMVLYSAIGVWAAWTDGSVRTIGGTGKWKIVEEGRLKLVFGFNSSASLLGISAMITMILFSCVKKKAGRLLLVPALLIILLPMCLTGSRTAIYTFAIAAGGMTGLLAVQHIGKKKQGIFCWLTGAAVLLAVSAAAILILNRTTPLFNHLRENGGILATAGAEAAVPAARPLAERELTGLTGREEIWEAVLLYLKENPLLLLTGTALIDPMNGPNLIMTRSDIVPHAHSTLLQTLLVSGIPGLLLVVAFLILIGIRGLRLIRSVHTAPRWLFLLPVLVFAVWAGETVECFIILFRPKTPMQAILFVCMGIIWAYGKKQKPAVR